MDLNSYNTLSFDELLARYRLLADRANKRLKSLERAGMTTGSAYKNAMRVTSRISGPKGSGKRFPLAKPANARQLKSRINEVQGFLSDVTSTPTGVRSVGQKIGGTISEKYGLDLDPEEIKQTFEGALWSKLNNRYGSDTAVKIIAALQKSEGNVKDALKALQDQHVFLSGREKMSIAATIGNYKRSNKIGYLFGSDEDNE